METTFTEPEELIESALVSALAASCSLPVEGTLAPAATGNVKRLSGDTFIGVTVDQSSQDGDYAYRAPFTFTATVTVHCAMADDADGSTFRDECRAVRSTLVALTGDGCVALDSPGSFACAEFLLDSTSTNFEAGENPVQTKSYSATIKGRSLTTTEATNG